MALRKLLLILSLFIGIASSSQTPMQKLIRKKAASGPTELLKDFFTDANSTTLQSHTMDIGGGWTAQQNGLCGSISAFAIQSNQVPLGGQFLGLYTADAGVADYVGSMDFVVPNASSYAMGIVYRFSSCGNFWSVIIERDGGGTPYMAIMESNAGVRTVRASVSLTGATNTTVNIKVTLSGNSMVALASTSETCNYSSSFLNSSTLVGILGYEGGGYTAAIADYFLVTN